MPIDLKELNRAAMAIAENFDVKASAAMSLNTFVRMDADAARAAAETIRAFVGLAESLDANAEAAQLKADLARIELAKALLMLDNMQEIAATKVKAAGPAWWVVVVLAIYVAGILALATL